MKLKSHIALMVLGLGLVAAAPAQKLSWTVKEDPQIGTPNGKLYIQFGNKKKVSIANFAGNPQVISKDEYAQYLIHKSASQAVGTWWAGTGARFFVVTVGDRVYVKQQQLFEEIDPEPWKTIATFTKSGRRIK